MDAATEQAILTPQQFKPNLKLPELLDFLQALTKGESIVGSTFDGRFFKDVSDTTKYTVSFAQIDQDRARPGYINKKLLTYLLSLVRNYLLTPGKGYRVAIRQLSNEENNYSNILFPTKSRYITPNEATLLEMALALRNLVTELLVTGSDTQQDTLEQAGIFHLGEFRADIRHDVLASWDTPNPHLFSLAGTQALAHSFEKTAISPTVTHLSQPVDDTNTPFITILEARYVFDQFSDSLKAWVEQALASNRRIETPLGPRTIPQLLSAQEVEAVLHPEAQQFYFRASDPTLIKGVNLSQKSNQDEAIIKTFLAFYGGTTNTDGLISKLRGRSSQLPVLSTTPEVQTEAAAEGGGAEPEPLPETPQSSTAITELLAQQTVRALDSQLQFLLLITQFGFDPTLFASLLNALVIHLQTEFEKEIAELILAAQQQHQISTSAEGVSTGFYDPASDSFVPNTEFQTWLAASVSNLAKLFVSTYPDQATLHELIKTLLKAVETAQNELVVEDEVARIDSAYVPDNLEELLELYYIQAFPEESLTIPFADWWLAQPLSERRRYLQSWQPDSYPLFDAYAHALGNQVLTEYFAQFDLSLYGFNTDEFLRANPLLASEFKDFLFELNPELLQRLASKNTNDRLNAYREILQRFKTSRLQQLEARFKLRDTADNFLLTKVGTIINPDQPALGSENAQNIASSVYAYSLTNRGVNALGVIDGLSDDDLANTYGVSKQQSQQFRDSLKLLLQARYAQGEPEGDRAISPQELALMLQLARQHGGQRLIGALSTRYGEYNNAINTINSNDSLSENERLQQVTNVVLERQLAAAVYQGPGLAPSDDFVASLYLQEAAEQAANSRLQQFWNSLRGKANPTVKDKALEKMIDPLATASAAAARGLDAVIPGLGMGTEALLSLLPPQYRKYGLLGIVAALGGLVGYAGNLFATTLGGFLGGLSGGVVGFLSAGPVGIIPGWMTGTYAGWGVGQATGLNSLNPSQLAQSLFSSSSTAGTASFGLPAGGIALGSVAVVGTAGLLNQSLVHNAFLHTLPTISGDEISPYITIIKQAQPGTNFSENPQFPQQIAYSIEVRANDGYRVVINTASIKDTFSVSYNKKAYESAGAAVPTGAPIQGKTRTFADLSQETNCAPATTPSNLGHFGNNPSTITLEGETTLIFPVYCETFDESFNHANVTNSFELIFSAVESPVSEEVNQSTPVVENEKAETAEVICFGECPQFQNGCWPTTGYVQQTTANESGTHSSIWAIDIRNTIGTPIYTPFASDNACAYTTAGSGGIAPIYGNHVTTQIQPGVAFDKGFTLLYGHMFALSDTLNPNACSQPVITGQQIGSMGISGLSVLGGVYNTASNSHLHYEIRTFNGNSSRAAVTGDGLDIEKIIPEGEMVLSRFVRSCYDTK